MTEADWLNCTDPTPMLAFLGGKAGDRKLRLFACACSRLTWEALPDPSWRELVEVAERYADGDATDQERDDVSQVIPNVRGKSKKAAVCSTISTLSELPYAAEHASGWAAVAEPQSRSLEALLLRDLFGNPFRPVALDPAWLSWNRRAIPKLAQAIYQERAFDRLGVLADALEEAGCHSRDILAHCRQPGTHVRGCWAVDLLLSKEQGSRATTPT